MIVAGGPVRDRAWILPLHLEAVKFNKPDCLYYLYGDCTDKTAIELDVANVNYEECSLGLPGGRGSEGYKELWKIRNKWVEQALHFWPNLTHIWVVDSDVIPGPFVLQKLLDVDKDVVGAYVPIMDGVSPIHMMGRDLSLSTFHRTGEESKQRKPHQVSLVGGCYLIKKEALEKGLRWGPHPQGEDGYIAQQGLDMWVDPTAKCLHVMGQNSSSVKK